MNLGRPRPREELVQPAARAYHFRARSQPEVVRVSEDDRGVEVFRFQLLEAHALHAAECADGHEDGRLNHAAPRLQEARARLALARERLPSECLFGRQLPFAHDSTQLLTSGLRPLTSLLMSLDDVQRRGEEVELLAQTVLEEALEGEVEAGLG